MNTHGLVLLFLTSSFQLYALVGGSRPGSLSMAISDMDTAPKRIFTGQRFQDRQYPSFEELTTISLRDLASIRPRALGKYEGIHYYELLKSHPAVQKIISQHLPKDKLMNSWAKLWCQNKNPKSKKVQHSIINHLQADPSMSSDLREEIIRSCKAFKSNSTRKKRSDMKKHSDDPVDIEALEKHRQKKRIWNARRFEPDDFAQSQADSFEKMLLQNEIQIELPSEEIEKRTRNMKAVSGGANWSTVALRNFLKLRGDKSEKINETIQVRRRYNDVHSRHLLKKKRDEMNRALNLREATIFSTQEYAEHFLQLLQRSEWWTDE